MKKIKVGSDFSGVGAFNQALMRLGIDYEEVFACDMDKYARQTFIHNYGEPKYFPTDVYQREIPQDSLDIYMTSPPCQAFSLAGKRLGKDDKRGILFFNSHEFIKVNKPRFFIFENVKGLLSDDGGKTFSEWVNMLGGKSVNGTLVMFPQEDSVPYHLYWQVLNAKDHGVPQNRERVFLIGIRDDKDNNFRFPVEERLTKRLKDVLEKDVDEKYFLSEKMLHYLETRSDNFNNGKINFRTENDYATTITKSSSSLDISDNIIKIGNVHPSGNGMNGIVYHEDGISPTLCGQEEGIKIKSATSLGYEEATEGDTIKVGDYRYDEGFRWREDGNSPTLRARASQDASGQPIVMQLNESKESGGKQPYQQNRVYDGDGISPAINSGQEVWGDNLVKYNNKRVNQTLSKHQLPKGEVRFVDSYNQSIHEESVCIRANINSTNDRHLWDGFKIRRLTPRECFRLMDFPDTFTWTCSDSQAYKQAGNSIVVNVLYKILKRLPI